MKLEPGRSEHPEVTRSEEDLLTFWRGMTAEQQRHILGESRQFAEANANDNVIPFDRLLANETFRTEAASLAASAGVNILEFVLAVNPHQYPAYSVPSKRCRIDRYLARTGIVDIRAQVYTSIEFHHNLIPKPFRIVVLDGAVDVERKGLTMRLPVDYGATIEGGAEVILRAGPKTRFLYVDHPMTEWIRCNSTSGEHI